MRDEIANPTVVLCDKFIGLVLNCVPGMISIPPRAGVYILYVESLKLFDMT